MLEFHSTRVSGVSKAEIFFPNKLGASILRTKRSGNKPDEYDVTLIRKTPKGTELDPFYTKVTDEIGCYEMLGKIRVLTPD